MTDAANEEIEALARWVDRCAADEEKYFGDDGCPGDFHLAKDQRKIAALLRTIPALRAEVERYRNGESYQVGCEMYRAKLAKAVEALDFLVDLKDYKDAHGKDEYYVLRQETAWAQARATLAEIEPTPEPAPPLDGVL